VGEDEEALLLHQLRVLSLVDMVRKVPLLKKI
jgi:hypothetical protein